MKTNKLIVLTLLLMQLVIWSCKKKEPVEIKEEPLGGTIDAPPSSGDYWLTTKNSDHVYWTINFEVFHELSTSLKSAHIFLSGDTVLFLNSDDNSISYGPTSNPTVLKNVKSSKFVNDVAYLNGHVITMSGESTNKFIGDCNTVAGESSVSYKSMNSEPYYGFYRVRNTIMASIANSGSPMVYSAFSGNTITWVKAPSPGSSFYSFHDAGNGITVAASPGGNLYTTNTIDLKTATWNYTNLTFKNTSDSLGTFSNNPINTTGINFINVNGQWKIYGEIILNNGNGRRIHAVNISNDNGVSWQTKLLTGIPAIPAGTTILNRSLISKGLTFVVNSQGVYKSTDGINFTQFLTGSSASAFNDWSNFTVYIK